MSRLLVVVDVQMVFVKGDDALPEADAFVAKWTKKIDEARADGIPVMFVQNDGEEPWDDAPGHPGWELYFTPLEGEIVVRKTTPSVFDSNPTLAAELRSAGYTELEMIGLQSEMCVFESSKSAIAEGFKVVLPEGMHATYNADYGQAPAISANIQEQLEAIGATRA